MDPAAPVRRLSEDLGAESVHDREVLMVQERQVSPPVVDSLHPHALLVPLTHSLAQGHPLGPQSHRVGHEVGPAERPLPSAMRHVRPGLCRSFRGCEHAHEGQFQPPGHCQPDDCGQRVTEDDIGHSLDASEGGFFDELEVVVEMYHLRQHQVPALTCHDHRRVPETKMSMSPFSYTLPQLTLLRIAVEDCKDFRAQSGVPIARLVPLIASQHRKPACS
eukprot:319020-Hanusia_phi.AAC.2